MKKLPQPAQKIMNFLYEYIETEDFQRKIAVLRKELGIPPEGYLLKEQDIKPTLALDVFRAPTALPADIARLARIRLREVTKDFPVSDIQIQHGFFLYLFYNQFFSWVFEGAFFSNNLFKTVDLQGELEERPLAYKEEYIQSLLQNYPVAIFLRPEASQRDAFDYVKEVWAYVELLKQQYLDPESRLGKVRKKKKSIQERNAFILKNKDISRRKLISLVAEKFGEFLDQGHIGKIISMSQKKRK